MSSRADEEQSIRQLVEIGMHWIAAGSPCFDCAAVGLKTPTLGEWVGDVVMEPCLKCGRRWKMSEISDVLIANLKTLGTVDGTQRVKVPLPTPSDGEEIMK